MHDVQLTQNLHSDRPSDNLLTLVPVDPTLVSSIAAHIILVLNIALRRLSSVSCEHHRSSRDQMTDGRDRTYVRTDLVIFVGAV